MEHQWERPTNGDHKIIVNQIGRDPRGLIGIANRCPYGYPQVIVNRPIITEIEDVQVFPTTFWLTCPYLRKVVGCLESEGLIANFQERISSDEQYAKTIEDTHTSYAKLRQELVPKEVQDLLQKNYPERYKVIVKTGVGGIRSRDGVKCLHTHLADYLARKENSIGEEVLALLSPNYACSSGNCELEQQGVESC